MLYLEFQMLPCTICTSSIVLGAISNIFFTVLKPVSKIHCSSMHCIWTFSHLLLQLQTLLLSLICVSYPTTYTSIFVYHFPSQCPFCLCLVNICRFVAITSHTQIYNGISSFTTVVYCLVFTPCEFRVKVFLAKKSLTLHRFLSMLMNLTMNCL